MKFLAALYVAGCLTYVGAKLVKADKYVWRGIFLGVVFVTLYGLFLVSVMYLAGERFTWK